MTCRWSILTGLIILLGGVALSGCAHPAARSKAVSRSGHARANGEAPESDAELEKRVRALAHYATGLSYDLNDRSELALDEFIRAAQSDPGSEPAVMEAARQCIRAQQPDKAIDLLTKAVAQPNASGALYAWLGLAYAQAGKPDLAVAANRTAIKRMPQALPAYQNLAQVYLQSGRTNEALRVLDDAARQPTDDADFLIDLADLYQRFGRSPSAPSPEMKSRILQVLDRANDLGPSSPSDLLRLADHYFALGELKKAEPLYRELLEEHPDLSVLRGKLTEIYLRSGQKDKASAQLEALAQNDPTNPQTYVVLGALDVDEKKFSEAAEHFERALKLDPDLEPVYYDLAGLKITLKKPEEALDLLNKARSRFKLSFLMEFYTGVAYSALKKYREALTALTSAEAVAKATDQVRLTHVFYFQLGSVQERSGNIKEAEASFRQCLKLSPDDAEAMNYLGYMWTEHGLNLEEARQLIEKAVQQEPDNAAYLDSLAWVLFKLQKPKEALAPMLKAVEHSPDPDPTLYDHLGDIYSALGQHEEARQAWTKALRSEPNEQIQKKLNAAPAAQPAP